MSVCLQDLESAAASFRQQQGLTAITRAASTPQQPATAYAIATAITADAAATTATIPATASADATAKRDDSAADLAPAGPDDTAREEITPSIEQAAEYDGAGAHITMGTEDMAGISAPGGQHAIAGGPRGQAASDSENETDTLGAEAFTCASSSRGGPLTSRRRRSSSHRGSNATTAPNPSSSTVVRNAGPGGIAGETAGGVAPSLARASVVVAGAVGDGGVFGEDIANADVTGTGAVSSSIGGGGGLPGGSRKTVPASAWWRSNEVVFSLVHRDDLLASLPEEEVGEIQEAGGH